MIIVVTGTPGTGKTKVAKEIAKLFGLKYFDLNSFVKKKKLYEKYDKKFDTYLVDIKKLNKNIVNIIKKNSDIVIDSHLSHYLDKKYVDLYLVVKCDIKILKKRLEKRNYSKLKLRENLDSEIFDVCLVEALEKGHKVKIVDTSKGVNKILLKKLIKKK